MQRPLGKARALVSTMLVVATMVFAGCSSPAAGPTAVVATTAAAPLAAATQPAPAPAKPAAAPTAAAAPVVAAKPSVYRIGHIVPVTGSNAEMGVTFDQVAKMAVEDLNASGGIDGIPLQMQTEDSMADPKQGITVFNKLANVDKVPFVIGAWSSVVMGVAPVADDLQTVFINYGANSVTIRGAGKYVFSSFPLADLDIKVLAGYVYDTVGARKGAVLRINNDTGNSNGETFRKAFEAKGGRIVGNEAHEPDAMDFGAQLAKIKATDPDVIHIPSLVQETPRIIKQAREMGIKALLTDYSAAESVQVLDVAGPAADGLLYTFLAPPETKPEVKEFLDRYQKTFNKLPSNSAVSMYVWDTVRTIVPTAIKYAQQKGYGYTGEGIRKAIIELKTFDTKVTGTTIFQIPGQDVVKPVTLKKVDGTNKKFITVTTIQPE